MCRCLGAEGGTSPRPQQPIRSSSDAPRMSGRGGPRARPNARGPTSCVPGRGAAACESGGPGENQIARRHRAGPGHHVVGQRQATKRWNRRGSLESAFQLRRSQNSTHGSGHAPDRLPKDAHFANQPHNPVQILEGWGRHVVARSPGARALLAIVFDLVVGAHPTRPLRLLSARRVDQGTFDVSAGVGQKLDPQRELPGEEAPQAVRMQRHLRKSPVVW